MTTSAQPYRAYRISDNLLISLVTRDEQYFPLNDLVEQFSVFFDLFGKPIKIELIVQDGVALLEELPILGDEQVIISFKTPDLEVGGKHFYKKPIAVVGHLYKISDRQYTANRATTYKMHFISLEGINNNRYATYTSYRDTRADVMIQHIYDKYLKPDEDDFNVITQFEIDFQEPDTQIVDGEDMYSYTFTGEKPLDAIHQIINKTKSFEEESKSSNYLFYQTNEGWFLRTIDKLLSEKRVLRDSDSSSVIQDFYFLDPRNTGNAENSKKSIFGKDIRDDQKILSLHMLRHLDNAENLERGLFYHTTQIIDPLLKRFKNDDFLYERDREDMKHLEGIKQVSRPHIFVKDSLFEDGYKDGVLNEEESVATKEREYPKKHLIMSHVGDEYKNAGFLTKAAGLDNQIKNPDRFHEFYKYQRASRTKLNNMALEVAIPGNSDLQVGHLVNINILANNLGNTEDTFNRLYGAKGSGGYWLVINVNHRYNKREGNFVTHFQCVRDVYQHTQSEDRSGSI